LEAKEALVAMQAERLNAAVDNMRQGLCMFDGEERLVICNAAYAAMYRLPAELTRPGTAHADLVAWRSAHGMHPVDGAGGFQAEHWTLPAGESSRVVVVELADGRLVSIHHQLMSGGGWVATHQDVTEDYRRLAAIEASERELKQQNLRFE